MERTVILDVSRLFSRRGLGHDTGIDRVERGYLETIPQTHNCFLLLRQWRTVFIFPSSAWDELKALKVASAKSRDKILQFIMLKRLASKLGASQNLRNYAHCQYINVGHSAHPDWFWKKLTACDIDKTLMIHDVLPLDYPEYTREDQIEKFTKKFKAWTTYADLIITPSDYSNERIYSYSQHKNIKTCPLAVTAYPKAQNADVQNAWLVLGTIEPRKNHMLLLDLWDKLEAQIGDDTPELWIIGSRGWNNQEVFARLDKLKNNIKSKVKELGPLTDNEMLSYFSKAKGVLFPSYCEGFGLPLYEACLAKKICIASAIPPFVEALGDGAPQLIDLHNKLSWLNAIQTPPPLAQVDVTTSWRAHLERVLCADRGTQ